MADIVSVLFIGLLGSIHCMGMCGGFAFALAQGLPNRTYFLVRQTLYYMGKTITYAILGGIVGAMGNLLGNLFSGVQSLLSITLGVILVVIGLSFTGTIKQFEGIVFLKHWKKLSDGMGSLLRNHSSFAPLGLGLVNGLLPCGLVYGALAVAAASGTFINGTMIMTVFGLATIPALFITAGAGMVLRPSWRARINRISGIIIIVLGLITISRAIPGSHTGHVNHSQASQFIHRP